MSIEFVCCECRKLLRVSQTSAGKMARCPDCGSIQEVPNESRSAATQISEAETHQGDSSTPDTRLPIADNGAFHNPFADVASPVSENPIASDETNPYAAPASRAGMVSHSHPGASVEDWARTCVKGPAILLTTVSSFALVFMSLGLALTLVDGQHIEDSLLSAAGTIAGMLPYGLILFAARRMTKLKNYKLAIAASILAMLPCSACCVLGFPAGLWALIVLCNSDIRRTFH